VSNIVLYNHAAGSFRTPIQIGPTLRWMDRDTRGKLYSRTYRQRADLWQPLALGGTGPAGGWLIEESQPSDKGCGLVEWTRTWAFLPPTRSVGESISYVYQELTASDEIIEMPIATTALVTHKWFHTLDPSTIPVLKTYRLVNVNGTIYQTGQAPASGDKLILAEDSRLSNWRGHLYERTAPYITRSSLTLV